jgi:hypothetical protein
MARRDVSPARLEIVGVIRFLFGLVFVTVLSEQAVFGVAKIGAGKDKRGRVERL